MRSVLTPYCLPLKQPLRTARGPVHQRHGLLVSLEDERGHGIGDCAPLPDFSTEDLATAQRQLETALSRLRALPRTLVDLDALLGALNLVPSARNALEQAALMLIAAERDVSLAELLSGGARPASRVKAHALVSEGAGARRATEAGFDTLKIKVGALELGADVERLTRIREEAPDATLRLDANGAWPDVEVAVRALDALSHLDVHSVEQPLPVGAPLQALDRIAERTRIALALDESVRTLHDVELAASHRDSIAAVVIKPMLCGGLVAARAMCEAAFEADMQVSVTSTLESGVGVLGALQLAASLSGRLWSCGLATSALFERDTVHVPAPEAGMFSVHASAEALVDAARSSRGVEP